MTTNSQKLKRNWKANIHMQGKQRYIYTPSHAPRGWVGDHHSPPRLFYFHKILIYALQNQKYCALVPNTPKASLHANQLKSSKCFLNKIYENREKKFRTRAHLTVANVVTETHCFLSALRAVFFLNIACRLLQFKRYYS